MPKCELPKKLEKIFATLAEYYAQRQKPELQRLLVNSRYQVEEGWTSDNWNGGTYGHAIHFQVPPQIYYQIIDDIGSVAKEIAERINQISTVQNEYIAQIDIEVEDNEGIEKWREKSGVLIQAGAAMSTIPEDQLETIWHPGFLRLFMSHKATIKENAAQPKTALDYYGVSCFVAHEDIEPTKEWQAEIEKALHSMEALLALLTTDFSNSLWTDQEVGVAIGRQVPIIPVKMGKDPYGFIGKYQALKGDNKKLSSLGLEVYNLLWAQASLSDRLIESLVVRFEQAVNYAHANDLMSYLMKIEYAPPHITKRIQNAASANSQVQGAWGVKQNLPDLLKRLERHGS